MSLSEKKLLPARPARKLRADAQRNRYLNVEVAKEYFARDGARTSVGDIATQADIGSGTLYRHFPPRDDLVAAVYRSEVEKLAAAEQRFAGTMPPLDALRAWMYLFIDQVSEKKLIIPAMETVVGGSARLFEDSRSLVHTAFSNSVQRAIDHGDLRSDLNLGDFIRALIGVFHTTALAGWEESARRIVDILIACSRPASQQPSRRKSAIK